MNYTILTKLLYVGFCFEKGRVYTNYWKPWYKKKLKAQVEIWRKLICIIDKSNLGEEDFMIIEELNKMCSAYGFKHYDMYTSYMGCSNYNSTLISPFSTRQKEIIKFIMVLLEDLHRVIKEYNRKKDAYLLLRTLHNLPMALFGEDDLINKSHRTLGCDDAINYAFNNMSDEMKIKYKQYHNK
ncbi:MAG TPA: hypothetical protein DIW17_08175 [Clostridiales bacterium]|jgi:hypothetical protein|nr:hypothetical protein [Clostridia bacterium]MDD4680269.1 hypothetical protein [Clostridia bacterium]HCS73836.1 hypothetical protein [Clostridiales bacterium]